MERHDASRLVDAAYRMLLGREPDSNGATESVAWLTQLGSDAFSPFLRGLAESVEGRRHAATLARPVLCDTKPKWPVISLGWNCTTAEILQRYGWRRFSTPFDWLFSGPRVVADCLNDRFATLLDERYHVPIPVQKRLVPHIGYAEHSLYLRRYGRDTVFAHHDPTTEAGLSYFQRCVRRFLTLADGDEPLTLVSIVDARNDTFLGRRALQRAIAQLRAPTRLVYIALTIPAGVVPRCVILKQTERLVALRFTPTAETIGHNFSSPLDELALAHCISRFAL